MTKYHDPCPYCHRKITPEVIELKRKIKADNARSSSEKRKVNGTKSGPKARIDFEIVEELRRGFMRFSDIAKFLGCSRSYISNQCKRRGIK